MDFDERIEISIRADNHNERGSDELEEMVIGTVNKKIDKYLYAILWNVLFEYTYRSTT